MSAVGRTPKVHPVCGFLGAGKTTFILEQLRTIGADIAVLVNEFGALGVDGETIRMAGGLQVIEMPGGCICCTQKEGLLESLRTIAEHLRPELILIEPSGIAEASELVKTLEDKSLEGVIDLGGVVTVVDAETFAEFSEEFGPFFRDQIETADLAVVNKADLAGAGELAAIEQSIRDANPRAKIVTAEFCRLQEPLPAGRSGAYPGPRDAGPGLSVLSVAPMGPLTRAGLERFLSGLDGGDFGEVVRAKGFLELAGGGCVSIQASAGRVSVEALGRSAAPRLTLIGRSLDERAVTSCLSDALA